jgi:two-component system response regulator RegX3
MLLKDAGIVGQDSDLKQAGFGKTSRPPFTKNLQRRATGVLGLNCIQRGLGAMALKARLLVVEDEAAIRSGLVDVFVYHGYEVETADNGDDGLRLALSGKFDLVLLDVMLPGVDGFEICNRIRQQDRQQPVIMLTAKSSDEDIVQGLTLGADDYVAKPFSVTQLVLRVQAVLRRSGVDEDAAREIRLNNGLVIDTANLSAGDIAFTRREMDLLQYLSQQADRPVAREELLARVWGYANHMEIETRTVDIHIAKLRRKIETDAASPEAIITVRGAGYRLMLAE